MGRLIIPDVDIARLAVHYWPEPTRWQATNMVTIALLESGGNTYSIAVNDQGMFEGYADRGLFGVNEKAFSNIWGWRDPHEYSEPGTNAQFARAVWDWRFNHSPATADTYGLRLVYAYNGWNTYKNRGGNPNWPIMWARAKVAVAAV